MQVRKGGFIRWDFLDLVFAVAVVAYIDDGGDG